MSCTRHFIIFHELSFPLNEKGSSRKTISEHIDTYTQYVGSLGSTGMSNTSPASLANSARTGDVPGTGSGVFTREEAPLLAAVITPSALEPFFFDCCACVAAIWRLSSALSSSLESTARRFFFFMAAMEPDDAFRLVTALEVLGAGRGGAG